MDILPTHFKQLEKEFINNLWTEFRIKIDYKKVFNHGEFIGGFKKDTIEQFIDHGCVYTYKVFITDEIQDDIVHIVVEADDSNECATIFIDKGIAILHNMSYFENCAKEGLRRPGGGNKLLRFTLNLIIKYKNKYGIKRILLTDKSYIQCQGKSETIKLAQLRQITHDSPWYSAYGFKPYDSFKQKPSKSLDKAILKNNEILKSLKTTDINIGEIIGKAIRKEKIKDYNANELTRLVEKYPLMRGFILRLVQEYDKYCYILIHLLKVMYAPESKLGLTDFYGKSFYLNL